MTPEAITLLFREARKAFPPLEGKPSDDNLTTIWETLLPILMEIPYDQLGGVFTPLQQSSQNQVLDILSYLGKRCYLPWEWEFPRRHIPSTLAAT